MIRSRLDENLRTRGPWLEKLLACSALLGAASCVPALQYEEARSAAEVEREASRRAKAELESARHRIQQLEGELALRDQKLSSSDSTLEQVKLEQDLTAKARDESATLVDQLRGELARVGGHLQASAEEKSRLERELADARARADEDEAARIALVRDLGVTVGAAKMDRGVSIAPEGNTVVVSIAADALFEPDSAALRPGLAHAVAARLSPEILERWTIKLREIDADPALLPELGEKRRALLKGALAQPELAGQLSFDAALPDTPRSYELVFAPRG